MSEVSDYIGKRQKDRDDGLIERGLDNAEAQNFRMLTIVLVVNCMQRFALNRNRVGKQSVEWGK